MEQGNTKKIKKKKKECAKMKTYKANMGCNQFEKILIFQ